MSSSSSSSDARIPVARKRRKREASRPEKRVANESFSSSSSEEDVDIPPPKARRQRRRHAHAPIQTWGDYTLQFQDDKTGRKYIHASALRFTLKLVGDAAMDTTRSVVKSLQDDGELEESRKVQVRSRDHEKLVTSQVRKRLRDVTIPARYVKIEDLNLADLVATNRQRKEEIEVNQKLAKKLEQQREILQGEHDEAKAQRDRSLAELSEFAQETKDGDQQAPIHPLLRTKAPPELMIEPVDKVGEGYAKPEGTVLSALLRAIPSPYDKM